MLRIVFRRLTCLPILLLTLSAAAANPKPQPLQFEVSFGKELSPTPLDGRVLLLISRNNDREPRFQIDFDATGSQQILGADVEGLAPGAAAVVNATALGYPLVSLSELPPGDYWVQGLLNIYETFHLADGRVLKLPPDKGEGQHWEIKPGNFYSKPQKLHLDPKNGQTIRIALTERIPPVEQNGEQVDSVNDWGPAAGEKRDLRDTKWIRHERLQSDVLTKFWGRPVYLGAIVLLPDGWEEHPDAHYPLIVEQDHFHRELPFWMAFQSQPPSDKVKGGPRRAQEMGYKLYQDWTSGRMPRAILMTIQHANPYFDDSYAVDSANVGPYGTAITQELIPYIEKKYRAIGQGWARAVFGGSTGGWEALGSQVFYPEFYNGAWVFCPDVVDFRAYVTTNLYEDQNAYWKDGQFGRVPRPSMRQSDGLLLSTMERMNRYELVLGTKGRSGEQFDIWQAVFSPAGKDGYPAPIFDKRTGDIDHEVAKYWKEHYDLSSIMQRDWKTLGPKLAGKLHLYVGEADTFYLDRAVHLMKDWMENTTDPYYRGSFEFGMRKPHCYTGDYDHDMGMVEHYLPQMIEHMEATAPPGADVKSWKY
ncbi:MAG: alpha/beta hydrolase-fold protein [Terriglobales bacterium]